MYVSENMSLSRPSRFSSAGLASLALTSRSWGLGRKTSSRSLTTSIVGSVEPGGRQKKWRAVSTAMIETLVRPSALGSRSSDSRIVRAAVATMPVLTAASETSMRKT